MHTHKTLILLLVISNLLLNGCKTIEYYDLPIAVRYVDSIGCKKRLFPIKKALRITGEPFWYCIGEYYSDAKKKWCGHHWIIDKHGRIIDPSQSKKQKQRYRVSKDNPRHSITPYNMEGNVTIIVNNE